jgi:ATP-binding cassette subfamily B (MDR/TAP) protein 1
LYILSFAPPVSNIIRHPKAFFGNPIVLYCIGTVFALIAGVGLPAFDIVTGWWTNGVQSDEISPEDIIRRGSDAGWIMTLVGVVYLFSFTIFLTCCEFGLHVPGRAHCSHYCRREALRRSEGEVPRGDYGTGPGFL